MEFILKEYGWLYKINGIEYTNYEEYLEVKCND